MENVKINPTIYTSRPKEKRIPKEERTYDLLDKLGINFARIDHEAIATVDGCIEIEQLLEIEICKNLFLRNSKGDQYYLLMLPGNKQLVTKDIAKQIGSTRLSFGTPEKLEEYLDLTPGSVSVLGLMNDCENRVQLLIDRELTTHEYIGCHPCINTSSLKISMDDILNKLLPAINHTPIFVDIT
ncbi:MAG: prolyl-tRNA synthetase associated domain-containing protein [Clostridiales bacterium]|nr:prolyl-tRNA synthetase associated domain-containing protein [Clostridiales bacterium]